MGRMPKGLKRWVFYKTFTLTSPLIMESAKFYMVSWRDISRSGSCIPHLPSSIPCLPREEKLTSALRKHVKTGEMWVYLKNVGAPKKCGNVI